MGMSWQEMEEIALKTDWKLMTKIFSPTLSLSSLTNDRYLNEFLKGIFGDITFEDLKISGQYFHSSYFLTRKL
ncbi:MAG: hypothetical protein B6D61_11420 [Bacteroidetes bacterium 4484_249]|nr:MAG: hypothetical protein B6D61_11420 [Bacteroidetes bacterium 4484_249]